MNNKFNILGIGGYSRVGKDTFLEISRKILLRNGYEPIKVSFAEELKRDIDPFLIDKYNISAWTTNEADKIIIRPLLVAHGCCKRDQSNGRYWIDKVDEMIHNISCTYLENSRDRIVFLIADLRFGNEADWLKKMRGNVIHLRQYTIMEGFKIYNEAANEVEILNDPSVKDIADQIIEWENKGKLTIEDASDNEYLQEIVFNSLKKIELFSEIV